MDNEAACIDAMAQSPEVWHVARDGYSHVASGMQIIPAGPATYAVLEKGRQLRSPESGRALRWLNLNRAMAFVVERHQSQQAAQNAGGSHANAE